MALTVAVLLGTSVSSNAQSNADGYVYGSGPGGATVVAENLGTSLKREVKIDATGGFVIPSLPTGLYRVTLRAPGKADQVAEEIAVSLGSGSAVRFGEKGEVVALEKFKVTAGSISPVDVSSVESVTIMSAAVVEQLPVGRSPTSVALLAPGTTQGVSAFGALASFGGASVAENTYYVNGFNLTNHRNGLGGGSVPFEFYDQFQVKTGGYGAEFGRSTGGVINSTTKRGTNNFTAGANVYFSPDGFSQKSPSVFLPSGAPYSDRSRSRSESTNGNVFAGGPIVKNRLFYYGLYNFRDSWSEGSGITTFSHSKSTSPFYGGKLDWNITDDHLLEFTAISDKNTTESESFGYTYATAKVGDSRGITKSFTGGRDYVYRYAGNFSKLIPGLSLSALYGKSTADATTQGAGDAIPYVLDARTGTALLISKATTSQPRTLEDGRKVYRLDAEYSFKLLGAHRFRGGLDREDVYSNTLTQYSGGVYWRYVATAPGRVLANSGVVPAGVTQYARKGVYTNAGMFETTANAYYLEDTWQPMGERLLLSLGLRDEGFDNKNSRGETFVKIKNQWAPRLGAAYDLGGNGRSKLFVNYGRYHLPIATNTNMRLAGGETFYYEYFVLNGIKADALPDLGAQIGARQVNADGTIKDPKQIVDKNLKPMYQDEVIVGYQREITKNWTAGLRATYRNVARFIEDMAIDETLNAYAKAQGIPTSKFNAGGNDYYVLSNPGQSVTFNIDMNDGKGVRTVSFNPAELRYPKATRKYYAAELFFEKLYDGKWFFQGSYTLSHTYGNNEGYVLSDIGQSDAGLTQLFDHPGLMDYSSGDLANDKRHKIKLFGSYNLTSEIQTGANLRIESGTPMNSLGYHPTDVFARAYGADSFYTNSVPTPRGSVGRTPWITQLDLNARYRPKWGRNKLTFGVSVFNVANKHHPTEFNNLAETALNQPNPSYGLPTVFQSPRSVRLSVAYTY